MADLPEALRLADAVDPLTRKGIDNLTCAAAAAKLRRLAGIEAERDALRAEVERLTVNGTHSCHAECQRPVCRLTRERDALLEAAELVIAWFEAEDDHSKAGFYERIEMCRKAEAACRAAIAKAQGGGNG